MILRFVKSPTKHNKDTENKQPPGTSSVQYAIVIVVRVQQGTTSHKKITDIISRKTANGDEKVYKSRLQQCLYSGERRLRWKKNTGCTVNRYEMLKTKT